jgi:hypothetical protein
MREAQRVRLREVVYEGVLGVLEKATHEMRYYSEFGYLGKVAYP